MLRIPLRTLLVGTALLVLPAAQHWTPSTQLSVVEIDDQFCTHAIVDQADGTRVRVIAANEDWSPENVEASLKTDELT